MTHVYLPGSPAPTSSTHSNTFMDIHRDSLYSTGIHGDSLYSTSTHRDSLYSTDIPCSTHRASTGSAHLNSTGSTHRASSGSIYEPSDSSSFTSSLAPSDIFGSIRESPGYPNGAPNHGWLLPENRTPEFYVPPRFEYVTPREVRKRLAHHDQENLVYDEKSEDDGFHEDHLAVSSVPTDGVAQLEVCKRLTHLDGENHCHDKASVVGVYPNEDDTKREMRKRLTRKHGNQKHYHKKTAVGGLHDDPLRVSPPHFEGIDQRGNHKHLTQDYIEKQGHNRTSVGDRQYKNHIALSRIKEAMQSLQDQQKLKIAPRDEHGLLWRY